MYIITHIMVNMCIWRQAAGYIQYEYRRSDIVTIIYVCMSVMTFPCITSIRLQAANNFLFLLTAKHYKGTYP